MAEPIMRLTYSKKEITETEHHSFVKLFFYVTDLHQNLN